VANKIERGLYEFDDLDYIREQFESLEQPTQTDPSFNSIFGFVQDAVAFFDYKNKSSVVKNLARPVSIVKENNLNKSMNGNRPTLHKHSRSKGCTFAKPTKKEEQLMTYATNV
jgi:hypothetical protein